MAHFEDLAHPTRANLPADVRVVDLVAGYYHVLAVSAGGHLLAWGRNDRGQLGRGHLKDDSCHLEVRTELPAPLDVECRCRSARTATPLRCEQLRGDERTPRLNLCQLVGAERVGEMFVPGNSTAAAAGELHSGAITRANYTFRDPARGVFGAKKSLDPFKYPGPKTAFPAPISYEPSRMPLDCDGPYNDQCNEQGLLLRWPNRLGHVYMFGDNRFGQLGLPAAAGFFSTPQLLQEFLVYDWAQIYAGSRQTLWTSRASMCSGNCNGHGICNHDTGRCTCEEPWTYELDCLTAWCPNNCTGHGACFPRSDSGDTGAMAPLQGNGPECQCHHPFWDIDCGRATCPNDCWGPDHGLCNNTDGTCTCVGNATVTYTGFDCYVPDPLHVLDPLRFYTQQLLRISPFFVNGSAVNLTQAERDLLNLMARYGDGEQQSSADLEKLTAAPPAPAAAASPNTPAAPAAAANQNQNQNQNSGQGVQGGGVALGAMAGSGAFGRRGTDSGAGRLRVRHRASVLCWVVCCLFVGGLWCEWGPQIR